MISPSPPTRLYELIEAVDPSASRSQGIDTLQVNLGLTCNMSCTHCHHRCSPERVERMDDRTFERFVAFAEKVRPALVDVTGGAPELHPRIRELVARLRGTGAAVQIRTNLSILIDPACEDLPAYFAQHRVRLLASLPASEREQYAVQRDPLAFDAAIEALRRLNGLGYGRDPELVLDLAVNPSDDSSDCSSEQISTAMRRRLLDRFGIVFDDVALIANMPLGRYADYLAENSRLESQIDALRRNFNPATLPRLACRRGIEVAWDGSLSDCDFNLSAGLGLASPLSLNDLAESPDAEALLEALANRPINFGVHCLACTAGSGSS